MTKPHPALLDLARSGVLPAVFDEADVVQSAFEHRVTGLVASAVARRPLHDPVAADTLEERAEHLRSWNRRLWSILDVAVDRLASLGIEPVAIKGITAEARWYDAIGQRASRDIDLWLGPRDIGRATEAIRALQPDHPLGSIDHSFITSGRVQAATLGIEGATVDLHFDPLKVGVPCREAEVIWSRAASVEFAGGVSVRVLDPETSLVVFLLHLNKDRFRYLLGLIDVQRLLAREPIDWDFVASFLDAEGLTMPATRSLEVVTETLGLSAPPLRRTHGGKQVIWNVVWRPHIRLRAEEGRRRFRKRQELIPFLGKGRAREGLVNLRRVLFPSRQLYEIANPDERGGYLRRVLITRPLRYAKRTRG